MERSADRLADVDGILGDADVVDVGVGHTSGPQRSVEVEHHNDGAGDDDSGCCAALAASGHRGTKGSCGAVSSAASIYNTEPIEVSGSSCLQRRELYTNRDLETKIIRVEVYGVPL